MNTIATFDGGLSFKGSSRQELLPFMREAFDVSLDQGLFVEFDQTLDSSQRERLAALKEKDIGRLRLDFGIFLGDQQMGSFMGRQADKGIFRMGTTVILPDFQGKGYYSKVLDFVLSWAKDNGFWAVDSRHNPCNNKILAIKLKKGFYINGYEITVHAGPVVSLIYFLNESHKKVFQFRNAFRSPDREIKELFSGLNSNEH